MIIRQAQSTLPDIRDLTESQQSAVGEILPFALLPVMTFIQGVKVVIMEDVHAVFICPFVFIIVTHSNTSNVANIVLEFPILCTNISNFIAMHAPYIYIYIDR